MSFNSLFKNEHLLLARENANYSRLIKEMAQAHGMIADVEPILWPARKPSAQIAILMPRSAEAWDLFNLSSTAATGYMHECCVTSSMLAYAADYNAEVFGIYTALATDEGLDVDFIDEDALSDSAALNRYKAIYVTQPNVPSHGLATLLLWVQAGGVLVTVSGAASYDEYNMPLQTAIASRPRERWCKNDHNCLFSTRLTAVLLTLQRSSLQTSRAAPLPTSWPEAVSSDILATRTRATRTQATPCCPMDLLSSLRLGSATILSDSGTMRWSLHRSRMAWPR